MKKITIPFMKSSAGACLLAMHLLLPDGLSARPPSGQNCLQVPAEADFGPTEVGDTAIRETVLGNACRHSITVKSLAAWPEAFGVEPAGPVRIKGRGNVSVTLRFAPSMEGASRGKLRLRSSDSPGERTLTLLGTGMSEAGSVRSGDLEVSPASIYESLPPGHSVGKTVSMRNHGTNSLPIELLTWVEAPGSGGDSSGSKVSVLCFSTMLDDDIENNFIWVLQSLPKVSEVVVRSGKYRTLSLPEILPYDLVVVTGYGPWADAEAAGNLLADYADQGGTVVLMHRALDTTAGLGMALGGRIVNPEYSPVGPGGFFGTDIRTSHFVDHPLVQSVHWMQSFTIQDARLQGRGRPLGYYDPRVLAAAYNPDLPVYFINLVPYEPEYSGHLSLGQMFLNIIDRSQGTYNWLRNPVPNASKLFTLAPGETREMILPVGHSYPMQAGRHHGKVVIRTTYPQVVEIPATLDVLAP